MEDERRHLWRAVDQDGDVIDILVQPRRIRLGNGKSLAIYPNSFTALDAISIAIFASLPGAESELAMVIRPNGCRPIFTEFPGPEVL